MDKKTGTTITIIVAVIVVLCCTAPLCVTGIGIFSGTGTWNLDLGPMASQSGDVPVGYGVIPCCLSILVLIVPVLLWVFLVRNKEDATDEPAATVIDA